MKSAAKIAQSLQSEPLRISRTRAPAPSIMPPKRRSQSLRSKERVRLSVPAAAGLPSAFMAGKVKRVSDALPNVVVPARRRPKRRTLPPARRRLVDLYQWTRATPAATEAPPSCAFRAEPRTSTTSCITTGCSEQNNRYLPGREKRCVYVRPARENSEEKPSGPFASVTSCEVVSGKRHVIFAPRGIESFGFE